ncbi:hypothetical protein BT63DRAFT_464026 [Microthyrium microscopicum]|uniref:Uncharacterized protein n=1 Tax=Microthyrium microscopicum TaxID=703497 RepID=A0A6A6U2L4_9PEZI|nr:hypothetical protein BT63DRAFT_464026 [Microthyrium microscopicum]
MSSSSDFDPAAFQSLDWDDMVPHYRVPDEFVDLCDDNAGTSGFLALDGSQNPSPSSTENNAYSTSPAGSEPLLSQKPATTDPTTRFRLAAPSQLPVPQDYFTEVPGPEQDTMMSATSTQSPPGHASFEQLLPSESSNPVGHVLTHTTDRSYQHPLTSGHEGFNDYSGLPHLPVMSTDSPQSVGQQTPVYSSPMGNAVTNRPLLSLMKLVNPDDQDHPPGNIANSYSLNRSLRMTHPQLGDPYFLLAALQSYRALVPLQAHTHGRFHNGPAFIAPVAVHNTVTVTTSTASAPAAAAASGSSLVAAPGVVPNTSRIHTTRRGKQVVINAPTTQAGNGQAQSYRAPSRPNLNAKILKPSAAGVPVGDLPVYELPDGRFKALHCPDCRGNAAWSRGRGGASDYLKFFRGLKSLQEHIYVCHNKKPTDPHGNPIKRGAAGRKKFAWLQDACPGPIISRTEDLQAVMADSTIHPDVQAEREAGKRAKAEEARRKAREQQLLRDSQRAAAQGLLIQTMNQPQQQAQALPPVMMHAGQPPYQIGASSQTSMPYVPPLPQAVPPYGNHPVVAMMPQMSFMPPMGTSAQQEYIFINENGKRTRDTDEDLYEQETEDEDYDTEEEDVHGHWKKARYDA